MKINQIRVQLMNWRNQARKGILTTGTATSGTGHIVAWGRIEIPTEKRKHRAYIALERRNVDFRVRRYAYYIGVTNRAKTPVEHPRRILLAV